MRSKQKRIKGNSGKRREFKNLPKDLIYDGLGERWLVHVGTGRIFRAISLTHSHARNVAKQKLFGKDLKLAKKKRPKFRDHFILGGERGIDVASLGTRAIKRKCPVQTFVVSSLLKRTTGRGFVRFCFENWFLLPTLVISGCFL